MLNEKKIIVGITGGIAAYKACEIVRRLKRLGAQVIVVMTQSAQKFITPLTLETLSENEVVTEMFHAMFPVLPRGLKDVRTVVAFYDLQAVRVRGFGGGRSLFCTVEL